MDIFNHFQYVMFISNYAVFRWHFLCTVFVIVSDSSLLSLPHIFSLHRFRDLLGLFGCFARFGWALAEPLYVLIPKKIVVVIYQSPSFAAWDIYPDWLQCNRELTFQSWRVPHWSSGVDVGGRDLLQYVRVRLSQSNQFFSAVHRFHFRTNCCNNWNQRLRVFKNAWRFGNGKGATSA